MLIITIYANNYSEALKQIIEALSYSIDGIELRLDYFEKVKPEEIKLLKQKINVPVIFTLRKKSQGGFFVGDEQKYLQLIKKIIAFEPDYFDLEYSVSNSFIKEIHAANPKVKLISSYHNFEETPSDFDAIFKQMHRPEFYGYKIATQANSILDTLRMLNFINQSSKTKKITGICMGKLGEVSRILAPIVNSYFNFTCIRCGKHTASGQLEIKTLLDAYNYKQLNDKTSIYALIGDPVKHSIGHIFHNKFFKDTHKNAVYVKLQLKSDELAEFFNLIRKLPFMGFSVTMPLKEKVLFYLNDIDKDAKTIKAVNTIAAKKNMYVGYHADGIGALNAIEQKTKVRNKKIVVLGAGGAARAIIFEATKRGARVIILNRTVERAKKLAEKFNCAAHGLDYARNLAADGYDILINATSVGMGDHDVLLVPDDTIITSTIALDMVNKQDLTKLLKKAKSKKCVCITGREVFRHQAIRQLKIWGMKR